MYNSGKTLGKRANIKIFLFLFFLVLIFSLARYFHLEQFIATDYLQKKIQAFGLWGPAIYLLIWLVLPSLFIPITPLVMVGGALFGPFWGEIYVLSGATLGASITFIFTRHLARDWVAGRLDHSRLAEIDAKVAHYGWKIVFISRLVPVLPYFVANYTFGLSKISLRSFVLATFFGLMPLTVSYVLFSANLSDLLQGKLSLWFLISACMVAIIIIVPFIFNSNIFRKNID